MKRRVMSCRSNQMKMLRCYVLMIASYCVGGHGLTPQLSKRIAVTERIQERIDSTLILLRFVPGLVLSRHSHLPQQVCPSSSISLEAVSCGLTDASAKTKSLLIYLLATSCRCICYSYGGCASSLQSHLQTVSFSSEHTILIATMCCGLVKAVTKYDGL